MQLFQPPAITRYDLRFSVVGVPVRVHPLFWVMGIIFGLGTGSLIQLIIWVIVVFFSILIHEMGHALTMRHYGISPEVILYLGGGLAMPNTDSVGRRWGRTELRTGEQILVSLAGPGAGFALAGLVMIVVVVLGGTVAYTPLFGIFPAVSGYLPKGGLIINAFIAALLWINIFWGVVNLVPVQPLDGGVIAREYISSVDVMDGERKALWLSVVAGAIAAVIGLVMLRSTYMTLLFGFLAIQSYQRLQGGYSRYY